MTSPVVLLEISGHRGPFEPPGMTIWADCRDLGLSAMMNTDSFVNTIKGLGTLQWTSPEVLIGTHPVRPTLPMLVISHALAVAQELLPLRTLPKISALTWYVCKPAGHLCG